MTHDGRRKRSVRRLATSPTTPLCQVCEPSSSTADIGTLGDHRVGLRQRLLEHLLLERAPLLVQPVEQHRDARRFRLVLAGQQARAQRGIADAAAGVDARAQNEAQVIRRRRLVQSRRVVQRLEAVVAPPAHDLQPLRDVGAVEAGERHHVGDGRQRDEIELGHEIGLGGTVGVEAAPAQLARVATSTRKHDARRAQMPEARHVVLAVRIDHGDGARQLLVGLVVVDDDDIAAELAGARQRLAARRAAVDGDDKLRALFDEPFDGGGVRPIALEQAVGDVDARLRGRDGRGSGASAPPNDAPSTS